MRDGNGLRYDMLKFLIFIFSFNKESLPCYIIIFLWSNGLIELLGALDGTHIKVHVPEVDKPRYRTRKNAWRLMS